ncbi:MAG: hypothetical protein R2734_14850 [Nocardioides sp.]
MSRRPAARLATLALSAGLAVGLTAAPSTLPAYADGTEPQTSEGVPGETALPLPPWRRLTPVITAESGFTVAPGVEFRQWTRPTSAVRSERSCSRWTRRSRASGSTTPQRGRRARRSRVLRMVRRDGAVAGVNGDFF